MEYNKDKQLGFGGGKQYVNIPLLVYTMVPGVYQLGLPYTTCIPIISQWEAMDLWANTIKA